MELEFSNVFGTGMSFRTMQKAFWGEGFSTKKAGREGRAINKGVAYDASAFSKLVEEGKLCTLGDGIKLEYKDDKYVIVSKEVDGVRHFIQYEVYSYNPSGCTAESRVLRVARAGIYETLTDGSILINSFENDSSQYENTSPPRIREMYIFDPRANMCQKCRLYRDLAIVGCEHNCFERVEVTHLDVSTEISGLAQVLTATHGLTIKFSNKRNGNIVFNYFYQQSNNPRNNMESNGNEYYGLDQVDYDLNVPSNNTVVVSLGRGLVIKSFHPAKRKADASGGEIYLLMDLRFQELADLGFKLLRNNESRSFFHLEGVIPSYRDEKGALNPWLPNLRFGISDINNPNFYYLIVDTVDWITRADGESRLNIDKVVEVYNSWWNFLKGQQTQ